MIAKHRAYTAFLIAEVYAFRNQPKEALDWLERAYDQHDGGLAATKIHPFLKSLQRPAICRALKKSQLAELTYLAPRIVIDSGLHASVSATKSASHYSL